MRRMTRPTAKLLIAVACLALVVGLGCGLISRMSGSASDSVDEALAAIGDDPDAALEYLVPEEDGSVDGDGVWVPGQTTTDRWTMLTSRDWGEGAEPLTTAVAGASARRVQSQDATDERAAWVTGKGLDYAAGLSEQSFSAKVKNMLRLYWGTPWRRSRTALLERGIPLASSPIRGIPGDPRYWRMTIVRTLRH